MDVEVSSTVAVIWQQGLSLINVCIVYISVKHPWCCYDILAGPCCYLREKCRIENPWT